MQAEYKYWDLARVGTDTTRRVPDVVCTHPHTQVEYVLDARIFWNSMSAGAGGYIAYDYTGWGAKQGERQKWDSWNEAVERRATVIATSISIIGLAPSFPLRGMTRCQSWWPRDGPGSVLRLLKRTGPSAFARCSMQTMKITRWARNEPP